MVFSASERADDSSPSFLLLEMGLDCGGDGPAAKKPPGVSRPGPSHHVFVSALDVLGRGEGGRMGKAELPGRQLGCGAFGGGASKGS